MSQKDNSKSFIASALALTKRFLRWALKQAAISLVLISIFIAAVMTYSHFAGPVEKDLPELLDKIAFGDDAARIMALHNLVLVKSGMEQAVPVLVENLSHSNEAIKLGAASALGRIGPAANSAIPELAKLLTDKDRYVRIQAAAAIWLISGEDKQILPVLSALARKGDERLRIQARFTLQKIGTPGALAALAKPVQ